MTNDQFRNRLTLFLIGSFVGITLVFIFWGLPVSSKDVVTYAVGQISGMGTMALGHYFTTRAAGDKPVPVEVTNHPDNAVPVEANSVNK